MTSKFQYVEDSLQSEILTINSLHCPWRQRGDSIWLFSCTYISKLMVNYFSHLLENDIDSLEVPICDRGPPRLSYECRETVYTINA